MNNNINKKELKQLFNKIKINDKQAYEELYRKYYKLVYGVAFSILKNVSDSEDVSQLVFTKIYEISKDKLPNDKEGTWLYSLTKNESISLIRKRNDNINLDNIYELEDKDDYIDKVIDKQAYNKLISQLNYKEKQIISLKILSNLSFEEIANLINEPTGTVKWRYYKIIHSLKVLLSNFAMFAVMFILAIKNKFNTNITDKQDVIINEISDNYKEEINKDHNKYYETKNILQDSDSLKQDDEYETIIQKPIDQNVSSYNLSILAVSGVFLIFTIISLIYFIKYQLKLRIKTSK